MTMKLFLLSASVFYVLGLKLVSKIEILPVLHVKPVTTSAPASVPEKNSATSIHITTEDIKKDSVIQPMEKSSQILAPSVKTTEK